MPYGYATIPKYYKSGRGEFRNPLFNQKTSVSRQSKGRRRNPRSRVKRTGKINARMLSDKKINTLVEVRMQEIAKKEVEKNLKTLTSRKYLFHTYTPATNVYTLTTPNRRDLIDWAGRVVEVSNIPKTDIETITNAPQVDDIDTAMDENADGDGPNQLMIGDAIDGYRWGDTIYVKSVSANLRLRSFELQSNDVDLFQSVKIKYAFVLWRDEEDTMHDITAEPDADELLMLQPFGYSAKLDSTLNMKFHGLKKTVLCQGETILNMDDIQSSEKFHTIYKKFDKPIQLKYDSNDQNGQLCNKKIYFVCRSTMPAATTDTSKPSVFVCTKINYYEA